MSLCWVDAGRCSAWLLAGRCSVVDVAEEVLLDVYTLDLTLMSTGGMFAGRCAWLLAGRCVWLLAGRCSVVNAAGDVLLDMYARPDRPIVDYRTRWSGIRPRDLEHAGSFGAARQRVLDVIKVLFGFCSAEHLGQSCKLGALEHKLGAWRARLDGDMKE